ncbi:MAG: hypothetical protein LBG92_09790 [Prevotellaceae bacterium]|nr:hypothetical protein [Prevotellaceae bacterium]
MKLKLLGILILILFQTNLNAQDYEETPKTFWGSVEAGFGGMIKFGKERESDKIGGMINLGLTAGYYFTPQLSLGAGTGLYNFFYDDRLQMIPVFANIRYHVRKFSECYVFSSVGVSLFNFRNTTHGFLLEVGTGYKISIGKRISFNPMIGYNLNVHGSTPAGSSGYPSPFTWFIRGAFEF